MRFKLSILIIILLLLTSATAAFAETVCSVADCSIDMIFTNGGSIQAEQGNVTLIFGVGGEISLGSDGSYDLGAGGSLNGISDTELTAGGPVKDQSSILLGANSGIYFGKDGYIKLGTGGNIEYGVDSIVYINDAQNLNINATTDGIVDIADINTMGMITTTASTVDFGYNPQPAQGVYYTSSDNTSVISVAADTFTAGNVDAAGQVMLNNAGSVTVIANPADCNNSQPSSTSGATLSNGNVNAGSFTSIGTITPNTGSFNTVTGSSINGCLSSVSVTPLPNTTIDQSVIQQPQNSNGSGGGGTLALPFMVLLLSSLVIRWSKIRLLSERREQFGYKENNLSHC